MLKEFFKPSWMRLILFPPLLFVLPAIFKICTTEGCSWQLQWLAGIKLLTLQETGELTFSTMGLWFLTAYFLACLIAVNYEYFTEY